MARKWLYSNMKCLVFLFVICQSFVAAQSFTNESLKDPSKKIVYQGIDNRIALNGIEKVDNIAIFVSEGSTGELIWGEDGKGYFVYKASTNAGEVKIEAKLTYKVLISAYYRVERMATPLIKLANLNDSFIALDDLLIDPKLTVEWNSEMRSHWIIDSFIIHFPFAGNEQSVEVMRNTIPMEIITQLRSLNPGDRISFKKIIIRNSELGTRIQKMDYVIKA